MSDHVPLTTDTAEHELLSFRVGEQEYSVDIMSVREIRGWTRATPLPHASAYICGVINLRGTVLPIIDLAKRLAIDVAPACERNVIIVVQVNGQTLGLVVDAVSDILSIPQSEIQSPPEMGGDHGPTFVKALTIVEGRMLRVLDLDRVHPPMDADAA
ncbi:chemotaxis protein CheW [Actibacterium sp. 188UL27-1]|uniref:chemotaxis protein CheW n=1 Tax=Actibacterium sp. 188UL27-1 TaxID=2786961 RepID=UPI00195E9934|nr:chemotaxis protein CheW [Actibacterium sp. 188UL27-1]MBM7067816.1 chemotaxis protein CheW [Actibacterium sp. 188UL27-1]